MGCVKILSRSSYEPVGLPATIIAGNPNPSKYKITEYIQSGKYLIIKVTYPDCYNFEGRKILVYRNVTLAQLERQASLDPHFSNNRSFHSPIARFVPTPEGEKMAKVFVKSMELLDE